MVCNPPGSGQRRRFEITWLQQVDARRRVVPNSGLQKALKPPVFIGARGDGLGSGSDAKQRLDRTCAMRGFDTPSVFLACQALQGRLHKGTPMAKQQNELELARKAKTSAVRHSMDFQTIFGAPILLEGEDPAQYKALADHFRGYIEPRDFLEFMWVHEIINYTWESVRYRRAKTSLLRSSSIADCKRCLLPCWSMTTPMNSQENGRAATPKACSR